MHRKLEIWLAVVLSLLVVTMLILTGCTKVKKVAGIGRGEEDEELAETVPPEAQQETVMIDGKPYVRSKNPYWLTYPNTPEYVYTPKGTEFEGMQQYLIKSLVKAVGKETKTAGKTVAPEQMQEMVRAEVDRIMREQGLGSFVSQSRPAGATPYFGRAVAVIPDLDTPRSLEGLNRTLAMALGEALGRQKEIKVSTPEQVREACGKAGVAGKVALTPNIKALGDALGVQGIVLTGLVPREAGGEGAMAFQVYDAFTGLQEEAVVAPAGPGGLNPETVTKFAQTNALRVAGDLVKMPWFGRVEFVKEGKVYLNLGQNSGLKVGDRLKVVAPGKEVVNPTTHAILGYTADVPQGEVKVTELLGNSGAVATPLNGGPFKSNDKVKAAK